MLDTVFLRILNMSYTASYVILVILFARLLLKKTPKSFSYALWSAALFRLVCPWSFESALSLFSVGGRATQRLQPFSGQFVTPGTVRSNIDTNGGGTIPSPVPKEPILSNVFTLIWLLGIAVLLLYSVFMLLKLKKQLKGAIHDTGNIYLSTKLISPFVMGVIHPRIYLSLSLSETEKRYILLHEQMHIRRFDHIIKLASFFVLCVHWFNPLVWLAFFLSGRDMEMSCDEAVIKRLGNDIKKGYSSSLLSLATGRRMIGGTPLAFGEGNTKSRIKNVLNYRKPAFWVILLSVAVVLVVSVGLVTNPKADETVFEGINAVILDIDRENQSMTVEGVDENSIIGDQCILTWEANPFITVATNSGPERLSLEDFSIGDLIVLSIGEVQESYPTRAEAKVIQLQSEQSNRLVFWAKPDESAQVIGETAAKLWLKSYMEEAVPLTERISDYTINNVTVIAGDSRKGQSRADMEYHYVVRMDYDITTASEEYLVPGDGVSGEGTFQGLFREIYVKELSGNQTSSGNFEIVGAGTGGGEREFIDPLELAVSAAVLDREKDNSDSEFVCESHVTLSTEARSPADNSDNTDMVTVYAMVLIQKYNYSNDGLMAVGGSHIPTAITFNITESGGYTLKEYWTPRDGSYYGPDIKEKFPSAIWEDALDTQKYILPQIQNCYAQAINYKKLDTVPVIENLFETLMSSPANSSNPDDYIDAHRLEYRELTYYGDYTLQYIFSEFLKGGQTGLKGRLMWIVMDDLIAGEGIPMAAENGQKYFDAWREHGQKELSSIGEKEMRENYPKSYLMLTMLSGID